MDITDAHLRTNKISLRLAPAARAARMWRRVPSGFRFVREAFKPTLTNSTNLAGNTASVQGFVVIFTQCSAQAGSHSRSLFSAAVQGLADYSLAKTFVRLLLLTMLFFLVHPSFAKSRTSLKNWLNERAKFSVRGS